jgi:hypothetical protein
LILPASGAPATAGAGGLDVVVFVGTVVVVVVLAGGVVVVAVARGAVVTSAAATGWPAMPVRLLSATAPAVPATATSSAAAVTTDHRLDNVNS